MPNNESKCFCHFNGYEVKDAKARQKCEELEEVQSSLKTNVDTLMSDKTKTDFKNEILEEVNVLINNALEGEY